MISPFNLMIDKKNLFILYEGGIIWPKKWQYLSYYTSGNTSVVRIRYDIP